MTTDLSGYDSAFAGLHASVGAVRIQWRRSIVHVVVTVVEVVVGAVRRGYLHARTALRFATCICTRLLCQSRYAY